MHGVLLTGHEAEAQAACVLMVGLNIFVSRPLAADAAQHTNPWSKSRPAFYQSHVKIHDETLHPAD